MLISTQTAASPMPSGSYLGAILGLQTSDLNAPHVDRILDNVRANPSPTPALLL